MNKHTPGPLYRAGTSGELYDDANFFHSPDATHCVAVVQWPMLMSRERFDANVAMFAAAPELLEALEDLTTGECGDFLRVRFPATLERAEAALEKVRKR